MNSHRLYRCHFSSFAALSFLFTTAAAAIAEVDPQIEKALSVNPRQRGVNVETVPAAEFEKCSKRAERRGEVDGLFIIGPKSQPLRWFGDTNKDRAIDVWSYYDNGVEVYRDIDSDHNGKVDQSRWFGTAGIRWGTDKNEDGKIDQWKAISAEEVTMEVVAAVRDSDPERFAKVLLSPDEVALLGLGKAKQDELNARVRKAIEDFGAFVKSQQAIGADAKWTNFGADKPGIVPAGTDGSKNDIVAYENVVAIVTSESRNEQLMIGSLVQVTPNQWRAADVPKLVDETSLLTSTSVFFNGTMEQIEKIATGGLSARMQDLLADLEQVEKDLATANQDEKAKLYDLLAVTMEGIYEESGNAQDKETWARQLADAMLSAAQSKDYSAAVDRLKQFEQQVSGLGDSAQSYVAYRVIGADYATKLGTATNSEFATIQTDYLKQLEAFVDRFPTSSDTAEAMIQLGLNAEAQSDIEAATKWYKRTSESFPESISGRKATGAIARLSLEGRTIKELTGKTIDGKNYDSKNNGKAPTILHFWATWCEPCKEDMKDIRKLQSRFSKAGLNIVGINVDNDAETTKKFLANRENDYPWIHLHEQGGFDSRLPVSLGVFSLPITIVLDGNNKVLLSTSHYSPQIETLIEEAIKGDAKK